MASRNRSRILILSTVAAALLFISAAPTVAEAQRRPRRPSPVVVIRGYNYHPYWMYDPWFQGPWGPYGYRYGVADMAASLRIDAEPRQAQVFVDGYYAGLVDDFDGVFQRLRLEPGGRVITLYLEGYRTEEQRLYLRPGADQRIRLTLQPLGSGEQSMPPLPPSEAGIDDEAMPPTAGPSRDPMTGGREVPAAAARFGTLALRVQPPDAEVMVDGNRWNGAADRELLNIELPEGRHHIEVRRDGMATYTEDVLIRRDRTLTLNVSLR